MDFGLAKAGLKPERVLVGYKLFPLKNVLMLYKLFFLNLFKITINDN